LNKHTHAHVFIAIITCPTEPNKTRKTKGSTYHRNT